MNKHDKLEVSVAEAAHLMSVGRQTAYELVKTGAWPSTRVKNRIKISVAGLHAWIDRTVTGGPPTHVQEHAHDTNTR